LKGPTRKYVISAKAVKTKYNKLYRRKQEKVKENKQKRTDRIFDGGC
jgi:hypothetical protein